MANEQKYPNSPLQRAAKGRCLLAFMLALTPVGALAVAAPIQFATHAQSLEAALKDLSTRSGIQFRIADSRLGQEAISKAVSGKTWSEAAKNLLQGYNYMVETGEGGAWQTVTVSGKNGDGKLARPSKPMAASPARASKKLPVRYQALNPDAVTPIKLPLVTLKGIKKGQKITLDLPTGRHTLTHDNRFQHENGDTTWSFYLEPEGQPYRAMISLGESGPMGHLITAEGNYQIVTENGQSYLIDINASGLESGSLLEDQATPGGGVAATPGGTGNAGTMAAQTASTSPAGQTATANEASGKPTAITTVDLLVLHAKDLDQASTRVNYLIALTNQAFLDSGINAKIRLVYRQAVDYTDSNDNAQALADLSDGKGVFEKVPALRDKYGADLVTLIRPFHAASQKACGIAWVNGSNGTGLDANWAYSVVSDGIDADGGQVYCGEQTLAHELGHGFGNVHDRLFSDFPGVFPYSYAWGVEGVFGTIMSYRQPGLLLYATPQLTDACLGQPCGYPEGDPNASDNARTINQTAPSVAGFRPSLVPDKSGDQ